MKALKITLILAVLFTTFSSCTKQDLNEDDVLVNQDQTQALGRDGSLIER